LEGLDSLPYVCLRVPTGNGKKFLLDYRLVLKDGKWRVYNVMIEGISMVKNYRDQFRDILAKDSPGQVVKMLREKVRKG
jgi:phospholipid transport system substrate-binding protein